MKLLIDTNIIIGLEDAGETQAHFASLYRKCQQYAVGVFVHEASKADIGRDKDAKRRAATLSKIKKFQILEGVAGPDEKGLADKYGILKKANDVVDAKLLYATEINAVDLLVTEDDGLHRRAKKAGLSDRVMTVADALGWVKVTFDSEEVFLPAVHAIKAYGVEFNDPIFDEVRRDYPEFDSWTAKCIEKHRDCWVIKDGSAVRWAAHESGGLKSLRRSDEGRCIQRRG
jgi:rRNA-processing protein FCF1